MDEKRALGTYVKLMRAAESVTAACHRHLAEDGLSVTQFGVLEALVHLGPLCQRDLARKLLKSSGNITTVIDNLEKRGLVTRERQTRDRRFLKVFLTEPGEEIISRAFPRHSREVARAMNPLSHQEQKLLGDLCRKLGRSVGEPEEEKPQH